MKKKNQQVQMAFWGEIGRKVKLGFVAFPDKTRFVYLFIFGVNVSDRL